MLRFAGCYFCCTKDRLIGYCVNWYHLVIKTVYCMSVSLDQYHLSRLRQCDSLIMKHNIYTILYWKELFDVHSITYPLTKCRFDYLSCKMNWQDYHLKIICWENGIIDIFWHNPYINHKYNHNFVKFYKCPYQLHLIMYKMTILFCPNIIN